VCRRESDTLTPMTPLTIGTPLTKPTPSLWAVYALGFIFTFQSLFLAYSNSTYLEEFVSASTVGLLYSVGAVGSLLLFLLLPHLLTRFGNRTTTLTAMLLISFTLLYLGFAWSVIGVVVAFVIYLALAPVVYLNIDIFTETIVGEDESGTGTVRGLFLVIMSLAGFLAPWSMGLIAGEAGNLSELYFFGIGIGFFMMALVWYFFRQFHDEEYEPASIKQLWNYVRHYYNIRLVTYCHFLLQLFFTWAVIYIPLYLATEVGLPWSQIGALIAIGALAYTIFELPIGWLADNKYGEKEMMAIGFFILALATGAIGFMSTYGFIGWAILLFMSRVGCSFIEVTTESYFFKQTKGRNSNLMSLFRMTRPAANLVGALLGSVCLLFLPFNLIFSVLALVLVSGIFVAMFLVDTR